MTTDPGDLVLDPTCGSGTTAYVAEQWGRRWITIDTSRVALALARTRLMAARYPYYLLADSAGGPREGAEVSGTLASRRHADARRHPPGLRLRARAAHHAEIDRQQRRDRRDLGDVAADAGAAARALNAALARPRHAVPRDDRRRAGKAVDDPRRWRRSRSPSASRRPPSGADSTWEIAARGRPEQTGREAHERARAPGGRRASRGRRRSTPRSPRKADVEYLYDKPYEDNAARPRRRPVHGREPVAAPRRRRRRGRRADRRARRPHGGHAPPRRANEAATDFAAMVLDHLRSRRRAPGATRRDTHRASPASTAWPGDFDRRRGPLPWRARRENAAPASSSARNSAPSPRADLIAAAREAAEARFDVLIACAFNFDAHASELDQLGRCRSSRPA